MSTTAHDALHAFYAAHPDVESGNSEHLISQPAALLDQLDTLLAAASAERGLLAFDTASGIREIIGTRGGMSSGIRIFTTGRNAKGRYASWDAIRVTVTACGHWYRQDDAHDRNNDTICRGCGTAGHFDYILDYESCGRPATAGGVRAALSGPARHVQPGGRVTVTTDVPFESVFGTVRSVYRDASGADVVDIDLDGGRVFLADLESVTAA